MNRQEKINKYAESLLSSNEILEHEIKIYKSTSQSKIRALAKDGSLNYYKLAELILKKKGDINKFV
jgi:hypothetical protein